MYRDSHPVMCIAVGAGELMCMYKQAGQVDSEAGELLRCLRGVNAFRDGVF